MTLIDLIKFMTEDPTQLTIEPDPIAPTQRIVTIIHCKVEGRIVSCTKLIDKRELIAARFPEDVVSFNFENLIDEVKSAKKKIRQEIEFNRKKNLDIQNQYGG